MLTFDVSIIFVMMGVIETTIEQKLQLALTVYVVIAGNLREYSIERTIHLSLCSQSFVSVVRALLFTKHLSDELSCLLLM